MTGVAYVHIQPAISIDVNHYRTCAPHRILPEACLVRNILKLKIALVQVQLVLSHIGSKQHIGQAIIVDVSQGHTSSIIKIAEIKTIVQLAIYHLIIEINASIIL